MRPVFECGESGSLAVHEWSVKWYGSVDTEVSSVVSSPLSESGSDRQRRADLRFTLQLLHYVLEYIDEHILWVLQYDRTPLK